MKSQGNNVGREKLETIAESLGVDYTNKNDDELRAAIELELNKTKQ
jgi:sec-independent protein translocase protein TatA